MSSSSRWTNSRAGHDSAPLMLRRVRPWLDFELAGFAFAQPAMGRPAGVGGVGGVDEIERRLRPGGIHQRLERGVEKGLLHQSVRLGRHALGLLVDGANLGGSFAITLPGVLNAKCCLHERAGFLRSLGNFSRDPGRQRRLLVRVEGQRRPT